jgi:hypothetical protein
MACDLGVYSSLGSPTALISLVWAKELVQATLAEAQVQVKEAATAKMLAAFA